MPKKYYWLKLPENYFNNKEIKKLRSIAGGDTYTIIYLKLQLFSLKNNGILIFENIGEDFIEEMALAIDESKENVSVTLNCLEKWGLIKETNPNEFTLEGTLKLMGTESESAERVRKFREKNESIKLNNNLLQCNNDVTSRNVEIEIEIEKRDREDIEKKENIFYKELLSFFNEKTKKSFLDIPYTDKLRIASLIKQGFILDDLKTVIRLKSEEWINTSYAKFLTFKTLFGDKFQNYLNQKITMTPEKQKEFDDYNKFRKENGLVPIKESEFCRPTRR